MSNTKKYLTYAISVIIILLILLGVKYFYGGIFFKLFNFEKSSDANYKKNDTIVIEKIKQYHDTIIKREATIVYRDTGSISYESLDTIVIVNQDTLKVRPFVALDTVITPKGDSILTDFYYPSALFCHTIRSKPDTNTERIVIQYVAPTFWDKAKYCIEGGTVGAVITAITIFTTKK